MKIMVSLHCALWLMHEQSILCGEKDDVPKRVLIIHGIEV